MYTHAAKLEGIISIIESLLSGETLKTSGMFGPTLPQEVCPLAKKNHVPVIFHIRNKGANKKYC